MEIQGNVQIDQFCRRPRQQIIAVRGVQTVPVVSNADRAAAQPTWPGAVVCVLSDVRGNRRALP